MLRIDLRVVLLRAFDLLFDFANGGEIFVQLAPVGGAQIAFQLLGVVGDEVENAAAVAVLARARFGAERRRRCRTAARTATRGSRIGGSGCVSLRHARLLV